MFSWLTGSKKKKNGTQRRRRQSHDRATSETSYERNPLTPRNQKTIRGVSRYSSGGSLIPRSLSANSSSQPPPTLSRHTPVLSVGYLTLDEGEAGWKRYWFVLSGSSVSDVALRYYLHTESAREGAAAAIGSMLLQGSRVVQIQEMIRLTDASSLSVEWFLCADTQKEATKWSETIEMASRAPEQCVEAVGGWGIGGEAARLSYTLESRGSGVAVDGANRGKGGDTGGDKGGGGGGSNSSNVNSNGKQNSSSRMIRQPRTSSEKEAREIDRRRALDLLHQRHDEFIMCFMQCNSDRLRDMTSSGGLQSSTLRSLVWMKLMGNFPTTSKVQPDIWESIVRDARDEYDAVSSSVLVTSRDVTGRVSKEVSEGENRINGKSVANADGIVSLDERNSAGSVGGKIGGKKNNRPLSSDTAGAIFQYMLKSDFQRQIWKDVVRTQQSIAWFVEKETQDLCARVLLVWSLAHPEVGYKQGMNELLAVIVYLVCTERGGLGGDGHLSLLRGVTFGDTNSGTNADVDVDTDEAKEAAMMASLSSALGNNKQDNDAGGDVTQMSIHKLLDVLLDPKYCEHDAYLLFSLVMVRMEPVFCPSDEHPDNQHTTHRDTMSLLQRFSRVQAEIVHLENPALAEHMIMCGVEPHMYLLRWMRLLLSREFSMPGLWLVWDVTIAVDPNSFEFNDFVCAALVLSLDETIREKDDAQTILYELQNFTQGFNIDIMRLLELARDIKTRLTGKLMESSMAEDL